MSESYHHYHTDGSTLGCYSAYLDQSSVGHVRHDLIDPNLSSDTDSMQRFLHDSSHRPILGMVPQAYQYHGICYNTTQPFGLQSQGRGGSPFSQNQSSNTSSALSPRTESDPPYESVHGPPTPPNTIGSPFLSPWGGDPMALTGISPCLTAEPYVNLFDINPSYVAMSEELSGPKTSILDPVYCGAVTASHSSFLSPPSPQEEIHVRTSPSPEYPDLENNGDTIIVEPKAEDLQTLETTIPRHRRRGRPRRVHETALARPSKVTKSTSLSSRRLPSTSSNPLICGECNEGFKDDASLRKHTKTQHKRPFVCVFNFAGCSDAFASKNEWKRHVAAQHLNLNFWLCTTGNCGESSSRGSKAGAFGRPFRRKDLYTQHIRRMHLDDGSTDNGKNRKSSPEHLDSQVRDMQEKAFKQRCEMPQYMRCPAKGCSQDFRGAKAWDERMEHVARHLEAAAAGAEPRVEFGGPHDETLTNWASSKEVQVILWNSDSWECCQPLKNTKSNVMKLSRHPSDSDEEPYMEDSY